MLDVWSTLSVLVHVPISYVDKSGMYANVILSFHMRARSGQTILLG